MKRTTPIKFIVENVDTGYSAYAENYPIFTTGKTYTELQSNILIAANEYAQEMDWKAYAEKELNIQFTNEAVIAYLKEFIGIKNISARTGIAENVLSEYSTQKRRPSPKQIARIIEGMKSLGNELLHLEVAK